MAEINIYPKTMLDSASKGVPVPPTGPFWKSPRFWFIGAGAVSSVLLMPDFDTMTWNRIVGQIIAIWSTGAWGTGQWDRTVDKLSK